MKLRFFLLPLLGTFLVFSSCKKESTPAPAPPPAGPSVDANESTNNQLSSGSWTVTSWTSNGVEAMQSLFNSIIMTYKKEDKNNGSATWAMIDVTGASQNISDRYTIRNNGKEIEFDGTIFNISVSGSNLNIDGNFQGTAVRISAKK